MIRSLRLIQTQKKVEKINNKNFPKRIYMMIFFAQNIEIGDIRGYNKCFDMSFSFKNKKKGLKLDLLF